MVAVDIIRMTLGAPLLSWVDFLWDVLITWQIILLVRLSRTTHTSIP